ncbi:Cysteine-rich receptor-like protein kinase 10 [Hordeum vulgare]|nr:Cysteine-rich receptor-like protein kinase 10 [Hordeum vulgare]
MAVNDETALKWARGDYVQEEMERKRRAIEEIVVRCHRREEGSVIILDDIDEEVPRPSNSVRHGDPGAGVQQERRRECRTTTAATTSTSTGFSACRMFKAAA